MNRPHMTVQEFRELQKMRKKRNKYGNHPVVIDGIRFDSEKEGMRWCELRQLEKDGEISSLERQKKFVLQPKFKWHGTTVQPIIYRADFAYYDETPDCRHCLYPDDRYVVEDVKSEITKKNRLYQDKKKRMMYIHNIEIKEI